MIAIMLKDGRFWGGVGLTVVGIAAYVLLAYADTTLEAARGALIFLTPIIAALIGTPAVESISNELRKNTQATLQVQKQTNGALTAHIATVAETAADKAIEKVKESDHG